MITGYSRDSPVSDPCDAVLLKLSKKETAAVEAVLDIALNGGGGLVQSSDITARQGIPPRYLEPILQKLGRADILVGVRGPGGGYRLARERRRITLWQMLRAMRAEPSPVAAPAEGGETSAPRAALGRALAVIEDDLRRRVDAITVEDLCWERGRPSPSGRRAASGDFVI